MKKSTTHLYLLPLMLLITANMMAQDVKEGIKELSKGAQKGYMDNAKVDENGVQILYKIPGDKKKDERFYESYSFDNDLKFLGVKSANEPKIESKPDRERKYMLAWVGGGTSFDILSMKLRVYSRTALESWDYKSQRFVTAKTLKEETVKLKNEAGKFYYGVDQYRSDETGDFIVVAYTETKDKKNPRQFVLLNITFDGDVTEKPLDIQGQYSMVFCSEMNEEAEGKSIGKQDFVMVVAPADGNGDPSDYIYLHYDMKGNLKNKVAFKSPSTNLLINSMEIKDGEVYFVGLSTKSKDAYGEVFKDYMPINNPYYPGPSQNSQMDKYANKADEDMDNFHFLKFSGDKLVFASTAAIGDFKSKVKTTPSDKNGKLYKGKRFGVTQFVVTPNNEYLVAGQLTSRVNVGSLKDADWRAAYGDIICLHFDAKGNVKAQYAIEKVFDDRKSEIFNMPQRFFVSPDGKSAYWEILEVKGTTGYASFLDGMNERKTFYPHYFPRITKINLEAATLSDFKVPGEKKFFTYRGGFFFTEANATRTYVGRDEDAENLWVGSVKFE